MGLTTHQRKKPSTILIVGPRGSGKTTFTDLANGSDSQGETLSTLNPHKFQSVQLFNGKECAVTLIDTPGLSKDPASVGFIKSFLVDEYRQGEMITGVIYIHPEEGKVSSEVFKAFQKICGDDVYPHTAIVRMQRNSTGSDLKPLEREFVAVPFFANAISKGARIFTHDQTKKSAREILKYLFGKRPIILRCQRDKSVDADLRLNHTNTGKIMLREISAEDRIQNEKLELLRRPVPGVLDGLGHLPGDHDDDFTDPKFKLQRMDNTLTLHKSRRRRVNRAPRIRSIEQWDVEETLLCVCCAIAFYAVSIVLLQGVRS